MIQTVKSKTGAAALIMAFISLLLTGIWSGTSAHAEAASPIKVAVDTKWVNFSVDPVVDGGTMLVQMRPLFESMGISLNWDPRNQTITGQKDSLSFTLQLNSKEATVNGKKVSLDKPARSVRGNTLVPLRFVGEATGGFVVWDAKNREITIFSEQMLKQLGLTKEQAAEILAHAGDTTANPPAGTEPTENDGDESAPAVPVQLDKLQGMYVGMRLDPGGYECGGACWDYYTRDYSITNGKLVLGNGTTHTIRVSSLGNLYIDDVLLERVTPVASNHKLNGSYVYRGYSGMAGVNSASSAWEERLTFQTDGTFKADNFTLGTQEAGSGTTNSSAGSSGTGTYSISGNTITLKFTGGTVERYVFFIHTGKDGKPNVQDVQIGSRNFFVDAE
ncbi:stalk domain-containing protein [Paenibacillus cineris]|uniref:Copper amine oxidase N-terminal domain-containing protein n=1 Tax=Paenibacillus cineris TaxID=237530 RepID=A0ABQ4LBD8_9BACL|nr:stalk domain-containing protein [Paenibacillus cineris]GIO53740.1 hypothetical protein J21TS7_20580 [Paenibacillus cineris]